MRRRKQGLKYKKAETLVIAAELGAVSLIFAFKQFLLKWLENPAQWIFFPFAAAASIARAVLAWKGTQKAGYKREEVLSASVDSMAAVAFTTAIIGVLATPILAFAASLIFTVALGIKTLFHLGLTLFHGVKALWNGDKPERSKATANAFAVLTNGLSTLASAFVFIAHQLSFGLMGVIAGAIVAAFSLYQFFTLKAKPPVPAKSSTADFLKHLPKEQRKDREEPKPECKQKTRDELLSEPSKRKGLPVAQSLPPLRLSLGR